MTANIARFPVRLECLDRRVFQDHPVVLARQALLAGSGHLAVQVPLVIMALLVLPDLLELLVLLVLLVPLVLLDLLVLRVQSDPK